MIINTFTAASGATWNVIALPTKPGFSDIKVTRRNSVGMTTSPFSMQSKFQLWPGADLISVQCSLPPMKRPVAAAWDAWLAECQGPLNTFLLPLPHNGSRLPGSSTNPGLPTVTGTNTAGQNTLSTTGWTANMHRLMLPGEYFSVGMRIYTVLDEVDADSSGNATVNIWPSLREVPTNGTALTLFKPTGLFRMASTSQSFEVDANGLIHLDFQAVEAR